MKNLKLYLIGALVCAFLFTSCSKDDAIPETSEMATLSFGPILQDLAAKKVASKQSAEEIPQCSEDDPAYVRIVLSNDDGNVVGTEDAPFQVDLTSGQWFTEEVPELELVPGNYSLDYFAVYNATDDLIWVAPRGGTMAGLVDNPLPLSISLGAGAKKYVEVSVLCFDDREVNEYGYLFFDIEGVEAIEFCIFGNYCDEAGRHYPAEFSVSVWHYNDGQQGSIIYSDVPNEVALDNNGDYAGTTVCVALPDTEGLNEYYFEISLRNSDAYDEIDETVIRSFVLTDQQVRELFDGDNNVDYYHFREGNCNLGDSPDIFDEGGNGGECNSSDPNADCDNDGVPNGDDMCLDTDPGVAVDKDGCESITVPGRDIVVLNDFNIFENDAMEDPDNVRFVQNLVNFTTSGSRNTGTTFMFDSGRQSRCDSADCDDLLTKMRQIITDEGFTVSEIGSSAGTLTAIPSDVKIIMLAMPTVKYTVEEINTLKKFAADGGRIIFLGEHQGFYGSSGIPLENQFLKNMGAVLHNTGGRIDCVGYHPAQPNTDVIHPIMEGVNEISIACASVIELGPGDFPLFYDTTKKYVLGGVAKIDTTPISELKRAAYNVKAAAPTNLEATTEGN